MYVTNLVRAAGPPPPIRNERADWDALEEWERLLVKLYLDEDIKLEEVSVRGKQYLRRHRRES